MSLHFLIYIRSPVNAGHDFLWILSRRAAACALGIFPVQLRCQPGMPCCNTHWKVSWWPWQYCTLPSVNPGVLHLHAVSGNFSLETRRDGLRHCAGAPAHTSARDHGLPGPQQRLSDLTGKPYGG